MAEQPDFTDLDARTKQVSSAVGAMSGTALKDLIYNVVPELAGMNWGEEIQP